MTTQYKVTGLYGKFTPIKGMIMDSVRLEEYLASPAFTLESVEEYTPVIRYQTEEGCERCTHDEYVPHFRCVYYGERVGHSKAHCTASGCY